MLAQVGIRYSGSAVAAQIQAGPVCSQHLLLGLLDQKRGDSQAPAHHLVLKGPSLRKKLAPLLSSSSCHRQAASSTSFCTPKGDAVLSCPLQLPRRVQQKQGFFRAGFPLIKPSLISCYLPSLIPRPGSWTYCPCRHWHSRLCHGERGGATHPGLLSSETEMARSGSERESGPNYLPNAGETVRFR